MLKKTYLSAMALFLVCTGLYYGCTKEKAEPFGGVCTTNVSYNSTIKAIIDNKCVGCHQPGGGGNADFFTQPYEGLQEKANSGALYNRAVVRRDMPPAGNDPLTEDEAHEINCWIKQGAQNN